MLSKILVIPFVIGAIISLYLAWEVDPDYYIYLYPCVIGAVMIYLFSPQLNWWWYKRYPPELPARLRHMINTRFPFYKKLPLEDKTRFRQRMALYMEANEFKAIGMDDMPADVKAAIAATVVQLTLHRKDFLLNKFEHIIVYPHPFPSPQYPDKWHASEVYEQDGTLLFSAEQLMPGFLQPQKYFNIGLYEYARVFQFCHPGAAWPVFGADVWEKLERVSGMSHEFIIKWIGLPDVDLTAVAVVHFFVFPERFRQIMPEVYEQLHEVFVPGAQGSE